jgi:PhzF family phenazine biosynthesis protein
VARELEFSIVDAFAGRPYSGNPAAVVFDADGASDTQLQAIAAEFRQPATTFVLPPTSPQAAVRFRWFTPAAEVRLCGHGAIAGIHALLERGRFLSLLHHAGTVLTVETADAPLRVQVERLPVAGAELLVWLDLPRPQLTSRSVNIRGLLDLLGVEEGHLEVGLPVMETQDEDLLVFMKSFASLTDVRPHYTALAAWCVRHRIRGVCLATLETLSDDVQVQARFFAPASGVNEDPVSGAVMGPLAAYLVAQELVPCSGATAAVTCIQAESSGRAGLVRALVTRREGEGYSVRIAGTCQTTMRGRLYLH